MRLAAAGVAQRQKVFFIVKGLSLHEHLQLSIYLAQQTFAVKGFLTLFQGQF